MAPRVLILDDSAVARLTLARRVRAAGFEVEERDSLASAASVDPTNLACAVLDFDLGDGFGTDVAERLRGDRPTLPIAFFSSTTQDAIAHRATTFGPVFTKPDELDEAVAWVERSVRGG